MSDSVGILPSRRCGAVSAGGQACRAWSVRASVRPLCSAHGGHNVGAGAPVGNQNRRLHGFYGRYYREDELADLVNLAVDDSLVDEIVAARVALRRVVGMLTDEAVMVQDRAVLADLVFRGAASVGRLVRLKQQLEGGSSFEDLLDGVLDGLGVEWAGGL